MGKSNFLIAIMVVLIVFTPKNVLAFYDPREKVNNKVGVHILFVEEIDKAAKLINTNGGDWGYVTIPIQSVDRNLEKWQKFMDECKKLHVIPILRIATFPRGSNWSTRNWYEEVDFANFLDSLHWPIENRYLIIYNEPNRAGEWGGILDPRSYAETLSVAYDTLKRVNKNFFILPAGFDSAAPSNGYLMDEYEYFEKMVEAVPDVFKKIDGWTSHSYPNPNFSGSVNDSSRMSIRGYQKEIEYLKIRFGINSLPVFITETGWRQDIINNEKIRSNYEQAFNNVWNDKNVVAVTVFLLSGQGGFDEFSLIYDNKEREAYKTIYELKKLTGVPVIMKYGDIAGLTSNNIKQNKENMLLNNFSFIDFEKRDLLREVLFEIIKYIF